jgi:hypothetical protein
MVSGQTKKNAFAATTVKKVLETTLAPREAERVLKQIYLASSVLHSLPLKLQMLILPISHSKHFQRALARPSFDFGALQHMGQGFTINREPLLSIPEYRRAYKEYEKAVTRYMSPTYLSIMALLHEIVDLPKRDRWWSSMPISLRRQLGVMYIETQRDMNGKPLTMPLFAKRVSANTGAMKILLQDPRFVLDTSDKFTSVKAYINSFLTSNKRPRVRAPPVGIEGTPDNIMEILNMPPNKFAKHMLI